ncbi:nucleotidyl transferase AbiEii/AbiGii toxin family protein [Thermococcus sp. M39]|uniref:nucleotidyl transferase AbiEii/AbiGii toxin family protein n=1 Tax=Thermococcus sp. M39 TaxID=1638262 RepID=UPI00143B3895|nr:nucleotidyl transferase AbiEii/AbiGii toxin family protein [Thermococcus sp. M39]NJE08384.1 nucleotidyl transferase AbiEii/AbiGii toxin family protein [Thermococcus sp. M39]
MLNDSLLIEIRRNERRGFANFVSKKTGIKSVDLVEWDYIIHTILKELEKDPAFRDNYVFKGGTCLVKCHLGYYRFSRDLDFAYRHTDELREISRSKLKKFLNEETGRIAEILRCVARDLGLEFQYRNHSDFNNHRYFSFLLGPGWFREIILYSPLGEKIKIEINYAERLAFKPKTLKANTILSWKRVELTSRDYEKYIEFLGNYYPVPLAAYSDREILVEKVRALLTRKEFKLRDLYDLYKLHQRGLRISRYSKEIGGKIKDYLNLSSTASENLKNSIEALKERSFLSNLEPEIERDIGLIVEPFSREEFLNFVRELRLELLDIIEGLEDLVGVKTDG